MRLEKRFHFCYIASSLLPFLYRNILRNYIIIHLFLYGYNLYELFIHNLTQWYNTLIVSEIAERGDDKINSAILLESLFIQLLSRQLW